MSRNQAVKMPPAEEEDKPRLALVESKDDVTPPVAETAAAESDESDDMFDAAPADLVVYVDSLGVSVLDRFSLVRVFREEWRRRVAFYRSEEGGSLSLDQAIERATHNLSEEEGAELFQQLMTRSSETIDFDDLHRMWMHSPEEAEFIWQQMKREGAREFESGHLAATVFEPVEWMRSAWARAKFLGVRDSFIDEYQPEGGVEIALVDTMAQAYFLQLHWTEEAVKRTKADPRRHSYEYSQHQRYERAVHKGRMWDAGHWEIPYATEVECQEQAVRMADHFSRLFQRTVRALDNHRLAKAKLRRLAVPVVRHSIVEREREDSKERKDKIEGKRRSKK
jgi:hypothetical protein